MHCSSDRPASATTPLPRRRPPRAPPPPPPRLSRRTRARESTPHTCPRDCMRAGHSLHTPLAPAPVRRPPVGAAGAPGGGGGAGEGKDFCSNRKTKRAPCPARCDTRCCSALMRPAVARSRACPPKTTISRPAQHAASTPSHRPRAASKTSSPGGEARARHGAAPRCAAAAGLGAGGRAGACLLRDRLGDEERGIYVRLGGAGMK